MTIIEDGFINCAIPAIDTHLDTTPERLFVIDELGYLPIKKDDAKLFFQLIDKYGIIYQNLVDAGCNQKTIHRISKQNL